MSENLQAQYNSIALHFDIQKLPELLQKYLPNGPLSLADFGCGDGPYFNILLKKGYISNQKPIYAIDLQEERLNKIKNRFPFIVTVNRPVHSVDIVPSDALDFVISSMVIEHVKDDRELLGEIHRVLKTNGMAFITTVFKKHWAWYFRKRDGKTVLDQSHLREYTNLDRFKVLVSQECGYANILGLNLSPLFFPIMDPILFRLLKNEQRSDQSWIIKVLRYFKIPIPGYYTLSILIQK